MPRAEARRPSRWHSAGMFQQDHFRSITGLLLLALMGATLTLGVQWLQDPYRFPLRVVKITSKLHHLEKDELQKALAPYLQADSLPWT
jgi:cell division septal protein FtsQ